MKLPKTTIPMRGNMFLLTGVCLIAVYVLMKTVMVDMTHDEAYSFYNVKHFWWVETMCTGNTHWFNFAAIKLAVLCGFEKVWQLRWFTSLSACVFLFIAFLWLKSFSNSSIKFFAFSLLVLNPYMLDYFSLARGYAAGMAFQALSLLFLYKALLGENRQFSLLALGFGGLSAIANFNFYYFFVALSVVYFFQFYFMNGFSFLKKKSFYLDSIYFIGISALVLKALWFITDCSNDIGPYGGDTFVESLFSGYINGWLYNNFSIPDKMLTVMNYCMMLCVFVACIYGILRFKGHQNKFYFLLSITLLAMYLLCFINRNIFNVRYPVDRTTLMFFPLVALVIIYFINELFKKWKFFNMVSLVLSMIIFVMFSGGVSIDSTYDYKQQMDARESFEFMEQLKAKEVGISGDLYGVYRNYYQLTDDQAFSFRGEYVETNHPVGLDKSAKGLEKYEYLVLYPPYNLDYYRNNKVKFQPVKMFIRSQTLILKVEKVKSAV